MQRKDERAIKYWAKGRLGKPTSTSLTLCHRKVLYGGRLLALRRKALCGTNVIFVDGRLKGEIDFGTNGSRHGIHVLGRDFQQLHEIDALFRKLDEFKNFDRKADADDIMRLANAFADTKKVVAGPFQFVPEQDSIRAAITALDHRYEALAWHEGPSSSKVFDDKLLFSMGERVAQRLNVTHAMFFRLEDAILFKLKHNDIKVVEL